MGSTWLVRCPGPEGGRWAACSRAACLSKAATDVSKQLLTRPCAGEQEQARHGSCHTDVRSLCKATRRGW